MGGKLEGSTRPRGDQAAHVPAAAESVPKRTLLAIVIAVATLAVVVLAVDKAADVARHSVTAEDVSLSPQLDLTRRSATLVLAPARRDTGGEARLRVAVAPVVSPESSYRYYRDLVDWLAASVGRRGEIIIRESYEEVNDLLSQGKCDVALICTLAYLRARRDAGVRLLAIPIIGGKRTYQSFVIVPRDSGAGSLLDLRGKRFASADTLSTSGWLYPAVWMLQKGIDPTQAFSRHVITGSHDMSIRAVARQEVEGAAVDSIVYDRMSARFGSRVKVILESEPFGMPPLVTPSDITPELREKILAALLRAHESPEVEPVLAALGIDRFEATSHEEYRSVEQLAQEFDKWRTR